MKSATALALVDIARGQPVTSAEIAWPRRDDAGDREWRSRVLIASSFAAALLYRWHRRTRIEPTVLRPLAFDRGRLAIEAIRDALAGDRRMTREAFRLYARLGGDAGAFRTLARAFAGARRLPLIEAGGWRVLPLMANDGAIADLVRWRDAAPDEWETRTNHFPALVGREVAVDPNDAAIRLCRNPASWHEAGGEASAAVCLLDATDAYWPTTLDRAEAITCDDDDHARDVLAWLKKRRPRMPELFVLSSNPGDGSRAHD